MGEKDRYILQNSVIIDPEGQYEGQYDILVSDGIIRRIEKDVPVDDNIEVIDLSGKCVAPGLIDIHFHLSEPARMDRETVKSASKASAMGGVTTFCPHSGIGLIIDNQTVVDYLIERSENVGYSKLLPVGALTSGLEGEQLSEIRDMVRMGIVAVSNDRSSVMNSELMKRAMEYANSFGLPVISFPEDSALSRNGVMNEGFSSLKLGLPSSPSIAETIMVMRDLILSEMTDIPIHISSVSTHESVDLIRNAKDNGINVTCDTCPHYFLLTDKMCLGYDTLTKVKPPLRSEKDISAIRKGIIDGTIDIITSDHTPLTTIDKDTDFQSAKYGISGVETLFSLSYNELVVSGDIDERHFISLLTLNPAKMLGLDGSGKIEIGLPANIIAYDPEFTTRVDERKFLSRGKNTPFSGKTLTGKVVMTIYKGEIVVKNGELVEKD